MFRRYHAFTDLPHSLPLFPLTGAVLLPRGQLPLNVFEPRYLEMVDYALQGDRLIGMIQPAESEEKVLAPRLTHRQREVELGDPLLERQRLEEQPAQLHAGAALAERESRQSGLVEQVRFL